MTAIACLPPLLPIYGIIIVLRYMVFHAEPSLFNIGFAVVFIVFLLPIAFISSIPPIFSIGMIRNSYVIVSPDGLEIRHWPTYRVRLPWEKVRFAKYYGGWGKNSAGLQLSDAIELPEDGIAKQLRKLVGGRQQVFFLRIVDGYPNGAFADDLLEYAPQLLAQDQPPEKKIPDP